jgi:hypothetical protein
MNNDTLKKEIIYGDFDGTLRDGEFIEVITWDDCSHITIDLADNGKHTVWNFAMKDKSCAIDIKDEIEAICDEIDETAGFSVAIDLVMAALDDLFEQRYDEWFEDEEHYESEMRTEEEICEYIDEAFDRVWLVRK